MGNEANSRKNYIVRWKLIEYDLLMFITVCAFVGYIYGPITGNSFMMSCLYSGLAFACVVAFRLWMKCYQMVIRYGGVHVYLRLIIADCMGVLCYVPLKFILQMSINSQRWLLILLLNLLATLTMRLVYRYAFRYGTGSDSKGKLLRALLTCFMGRKFIKESYGKDKVSKVRIAIMGAGRLGAVLADELQTNDSASYRPVCFIDGDKSKIGREIMDLPVVAEGRLGIDELREHGVQQIVFAITELTEEKREFLIKFYHEAGYKIKTYDFPMSDVSKHGKRTLRDFDVEELLFRKQIIINSENTAAYYKGKTVLVTGGGGSIGSELCRQLAKMGTKTIVALDIYENGVYDLQQELRELYGGEVDFRPEIASICSESAMTRIMEEYRPQVVINAAAHKHVPLMEKNCVEAVENNVFGSLNIIKLSEKYGVERFMTVSTDKAVNPTNVMGATKRMCEIIEQAHSASGTKTTFSATRFGNVLGSAGSVIPLFKRQIANGGPVTITDKRIIRYFMTIPEASQLVLESGAMAKNGELFVLDMGQPVKIYDLAENMIKLSGLIPGKDIEIIETGLRPGEKLYEELLVESETLTKTENKLIFIEKDEPISMEELEQRLALLEEAVKRNDDMYMKEVLHRVVPTFKTPEEVNAEAEKSKEMRSCGLDV